ncbi:hypothetical protein [Chryseobacterium sp. ISL-6]|uniref:hypothetical protein n=1 Tax=Chryseobacterium sp. ISL-6 TaxID=2819143 RepID=UPI001BE6429E|nr:hypothetical protein [Chryseobacterium sp. ISL-6]MBT2622748.1 hypothetical protein [Chryseobacterium sp. ISL-6]
MKLKYIVCGLLLIIANSLALAQVRAHVSGKSYDLNLLILLREVSSLQLMTKDQLQGLIQFPMGMLIIMMISISTVKI